MFRKYTVQEYTWMFVRMNLTRQNSRSKGINLLSFTRAFGQFLKLCLCRKRGRSKWIFASKLHRTRELALLLVEGGNVRSNIRGSARQNFDPLSLQTSSSPFSTLWTRNGTGRGGRRCGDRRNYHNHFRGWGRKTTEARFQNINRHNTSGQHAA